MNFSDIFKSSFLENVGSVSILDMIITLVLSFAIGLFIFMVYKKTYNGVMYSSSFGVTLIALTIITNVLILAVTSNVVLSLGMVGALSIVRFRTAIKEPLDIAFLFLVNRCRNYSCRRIFATCCNRKRGNRKCSAGFRQQEITSQPIHGCCFMCRL